MGRYYIVSLLSIMDKKLQHFYVFLAFYRYLYSLYLTDLHAQYKYIQLLSLINFRQLLTVEFLFHISASPAAGCKNDSY